jgi:mannose-6-phosphate isomerase-like protein (cupin superfamily)
VKRGLSLRELARRANVSPSLLSAVERGVGEPSISSLRRMAEALEVSIFYLLDEREDGKHPAGRSLQEQIVRREDRRRVTLPHSGLSYELLCPDTKRRSEVWIATLEPGATTGDGLRGHMSEEFMLIISGQTELEYGDEKVILGEGDSIYIDGSVPHCMRALGPTPLVFLSVLTPPVL